MTLENLRELWSTKPFKPMTIQMVGGKELQVPHPDHLFFVPGDDMLFVVSQANGKRQFRFLTPDQIASVAT